MKIYKEEDKDKEKDKDKNKNTIIVIIAIIKNIKIYKLLHLIQVCYFLKIKNNNKNKINKIIYKKYMEE